MMIKSDFSNAKIGDVVKDIFLTEGIIKEINKSTNLIGVELDDNEIDWFDLEGYYVGDDRRSSTPVLFYHFEGQFPTKEACKRLMPKIELIKSTTKNCCNCVGCGEACENSKAWIYCDKLADIADIEGYDETGELTGCNFFKYRIKVDDKVIVWDEGEEFHEYFKEFDESNRLIFWGNGRTSWSSKSKVKYVADYWRLASDEKINSGNLEEIEG